MDKFNLKKINLYNLLYEMHNDAPFGIYLLEPIRLKKIKNSTFLDTLV